MFLHRYPGMSMYQPSWNRIITMGQPYNIYIIHSLLPVLVSTHHRDFHFLGTGCFQPR